MLCDRNVMNEEVQKHMPLPSKQFHNHFLVTVTPGCLVICFDWALGDPVIESILSLHLQ